MPINNLDRVLKPDQQAKGALALMVSLVGHAIFLLLLAFWVFLPGMPDQGLSIRFESGESEVAPLLELPSSAESWEQAQSSASSAAATQPQRVELAVESLQILPEQWEAAPTDPSIFSTMATLASVAARDSAQALSDSDARQGASFFGAYAPGSRFVYVLDTSKSMEGQRWTLAKQKLMQSLRELGPNRQFFVICFDARTSLLFNQKPDQVDFLAADGSTVQRVERWLRSRELGPATMPARALELALSLQPDAIFFLSDGELHDDSLYRLRWLNVDDGQRRKVPIHSIHLISQDGRYTSEQIARENAGTFTYISERSRRRR